MAVRERWDRRRWGSGCGSLAARGNDGHEGRGGSGQGMRGRWRREGKVSREKGVGLPGSRVAALVGCMQGLGGPKGPA